LRSVNFDIGIPFTDIVFIPAKLGGVLGMFGAVAILVILPWLDTHPVRSARFRPLFRIALAVFVVDFIILGWIGMNAADAVLFSIGSFQFPMLWLGQLGTLYYFGFFMAILPALSGINLNLTIPVIGKKISLFVPAEKTLPLPTSIHDAVLKAKGAH